MTSAAAVACALVADLLKDGPRAAAEILSAAEGAKVSQRSIQRAAVDLGVVKTRTAFRSGWTWRLRDDDDATTETPAEEIPSSVIANDNFSAQIEILGNVGVAAQIEHTGPVKDRENSEQPATRAKIIADRLRNLEVSRGKVAPIHAGDPRLLRWVAAGISDPDLREAYELAVFALETERSPAPVTAGFLDRYIDKAI